MIWSKRPFLDRSKFWIGADGRVREKVPVQLTDTFLRIGTRLIGSSGGGRWMHYMDMPAAPAGKCYVMARVLSGWLLFAFVQRRLINVKMQWTSSIA
jgi:hypothetical protein